MPEVKWDQIGFVDFTYIKIMFFFLEIGRKSISANSHIYNYDHKIKLHMNFFCTYNIFYGFQLVVSSSSQSSLLVAFFPSNLDISMDSPGFLLIWPFIAGRQPEKLLQMLRQNCLLFWWQIS